MAAKKPHPPLKGRGGLAVAHVQSPPMKRVWGGLLGCLIAASAARATDDIEILRYKESITPDVATKTITGRTIIRLRMRQAGVSEVRFPQHALIIDAWVNE